MKFIGHEYLVQTLGPIITKIYAHKKSCEIDTNKMEKASQLEGNVKKVESFVSQALAAVFASISECPL
jgi:hypothetical protein